MWAVPDGTTAEDIAARGIFEIAVEDRGDLSGTFDGIGAPTSAAPATLTRTLDIPGRVAAICVSHPDRDVQYSSFFRVVGE